MPATHRKGRPLRYATVLAVQAQLRLPFADKTEIAERHGVERHLLRDIERRKTPAQKRVARCRGCRGKLINKANPCLTCTLRNQTAA